MKTITLQEAYALVQGRSIVDDKKHAENVAHLTVHAFNHLPKVVEALESIMEIANRYCSHGNELGGKYNDAEFKKARAILAAAKQVEVP